MQLKGLHRREALGVEERVAVGVCLHIDSARVVDGLFSAVGQGMADEEVEWMAKVAGEVHLPHSVGLSVAKPERQN